MFNVNPSQLRAQAEQRQQEEESMEELREEVSQAEEALSAEEEELTETQRMVDYLLDHYDVPNLNWDYTNDKRINNILKLEENPRKLRATYACIRSQMRSVERQGLTRYLVDQLANLLMRISGDPDTMTRIKQDQYLQDAFHRILKGLDYIPPSVVAALATFHHTYNAFLIRWSSNKVDKPRGTISGAPV